jgi:hypothetical protein
VTPNLVSLTSTAITITVKVSAAAVTGTRNVTVSDNIGSATCAGCFTVDADPTATSASPNQMSAGTSGTVTFQGNGFQSGATVAFSGPSTNVTAKQSTVVVTTTTLSVTVNVPAGTSLGSYTSKITNPDGGKATCSNCLTVIAAPTLTSMSPSSVAQHTTSMVTLMGAGFASGATLKGPSGVTFTNIVVTSSTTITATMKVTATAPKGSDLTVTVTNDAASGYGKATSDLLNIT